MSDSSTVDNARLSLLLKELRLPAMTALWNEFAERSDTQGWPAARFLATMAEHEFAERDRCCSSIMRFLYSIYMTFGFSYLNNVLPETEVNHLLDGDDSFLSKII